MYQYNAVVIKVTFDDDAKKKQKKQDYKEMMSKQLWVYLWHQKLTMQRSILE